MDNYFPNKVHQQLIKEPLVILEKAEIYDVIARLHGGGVTGQAGALRLAIARALIELDETDRPPLKKAGLPDPGRPRHRAQEVRPEEGPQGSPVLEALTAVVGRLFGTDGVRGLANADLTPELALRLATAAAQVLGERRGLASPHPCRERRVAARWPPSR